MNIAEAAFKVFGEYGVPFEAHIMSAHRTPDRAREFSMSAEKNGFGVIIAMAGMAAHLAGAVAANTVLPVIGVPVKSSLEGLDALLSTVQMPPGIPVATVAVNGGTNAAILAVQILAGADAGLTEKLYAKKTAMAEAVVKKDEDLQNNYEF
ncbi:MAG: 5-(carboxyamino)imidazole ribonucleotide mutase [Oscillospiraceae bacterium]|nr:5-(carboxyamino)imidazole ribonucleotide mutase [Oscillospiraceae bacterium]